MTMTVHRSAITPQACDARRMGRGSTRVILCAWDDHRQGWAWSCIGQGPLVPVVTGGHAVPGAPPIRLSASRPLSEDDGTGVRWRRGHRP